MSVRTRARSSALLVLGGLVGVVLVGLGPVGTASGSPAATVSPRLAGAAVAAAVAPNCGPHVYYRPDGTRWRCTFVDYFGGTVLKPSKWAVVTSNTANWGTGREDCFVNSKNNIAVHKGILTLVSVRGLAPFSCGPRQRAYTATATSATVSTIGKYTQHFGRVEIRAKFPYTAQKGIQTALWLWPTNDSGAALGLSGEIDIAEWYSQYADRVIPYLHYPLSFLNPSAATNTSCLVPNVANWHTYVLDWTRNQISISYDGRVCLRNTSPGSFFDESVFLSLTQALGVQANAPTASTPKRSMTQIDYVRIWS